MLLKPCQVIKWIIKSRVKCWLAHRNYIHSHNVKMCTYCMFIDFLLCRLWDLISNLCYCSVSFMQSWECFLKWLLVQGQKMASWNFDIQKILTLPTKIKISNPENLPQIIFQHNVCACVPNLLFHFMENLALFMCPLNFIAVNGTIWCFC